MSNTPDLNGSPWGATWDLLIGEAVVIGDTVHFPSLLNTVTGRTAVIHVGGADYPADEATWHAMKAIDAGTWTWKR